MEEVAVLAAVRSATLIGVDGQPVTVEVHVSPVCPRTRSSVCPTPPCASRARTCARRGAVVGARVADAPHHGQPRARRRAQVRLRVRARGRARCCWPPTTSCPPGCSTASPCSASSGSTARCARCRAPSHSSTRWPASGSTPVIVPMANAAEAGLVRDVQVRAARTLAELRACLKGEETWPDWDRPRAERAERRPLDDELRRSRRRARPRVRTAGARGRGRGWAPPAVRRATGHGQDDAGPPARHDRCPPLEHAEALEVTRIHSAAGQPTGGRLVTRAPVPRAAPHRVHPRARRRRQRAATSGRGHPRAPRNALPRRARRVRADRARRVATTARGARGAHLAARPCRSRSRRRSSSSRARIPARAGSASPSCRCTDAQRARYRRRLSAPLLDRFDLRVRVTAPEPRDQPRRVLGRRRAARVAARSSASGRATPTGRGRRTRTSPPASSTGCCRSAPTPTTCGEI